MCGSNIHIPRNLWIICTVTYDFYFPILVKNFKGPPPTILTKNPKKKTLILNLWGYKRNLKF